MTLKSTTALGLAFGLLAAPAIAQDSKFYVQLGAANIDL